MPEFRLPDLGEGVTEGEVVEWRVAEGATVSRDQILVVVGTDKATVEIPSPFAGRVDALLAAEGAKIRVGDALLRVDTGAEPLPIGTRSNHRRSRGQSVGRVASPAPTTRISASSAAVGPSRRPPAWPGIGRAGRERTPGPSADGGPFGIRAASPTSGRRPADGRAYDRGPPAGAAGHSCA